MTGGMALGLLLAHLVGDYILQSDWMAHEKTKRWWPAIAHAVTYGLPFLLLTQSPWALLVIIGSHAVIDRYRLARYVVWAKNQFAPKWWRYPFTDGVGTGYHHTRAPWMAVWLMIIADNAIHLAINAGAVLWL